FTFPYRARPAQTYTLSRHDALPILAMLRTRTVMANVVSDSVTIRGLIAFTSTRSIGCCAGSCCCWAAAGKPHSVLSRTNNAATAAAAALTRSVTGFIGRTWGQAGPGGIDQVQRLACERALVGVGGPALQIA